MDTDTPYEEQIYVYPTAVMEIATMLLCHEGFSLQRARASVIPDDFDGGRKPRVTWFICCPDQEQLEGLLEDHRRSSVGIQIGVKQYERVRSAQVVRAMREAWGRLEEQNGYGT